MALLSQTFFDKLTIPGTFYFFFGINLLGGIFVTIFMKETKGLTKEQQISLYSYKEEFEPERRYSSLNKRDAEYELT